MTRGTLIALGLTAATLGLVLSRREAAAPSAGPAVDIKSAPAEPLPRRSPLDIFTTSPFGPPPPPPPPPGVFPRESPLGQRPQPTFDLYPYKVAELRAQRAALETRVSTRAAGVLDEEVMRLANNFRNAGLQAEAIAIEAILSRLPYERLRQSGVGGLPGSGV